MGAELSSYVKFIPQTFYFKSFSKQMPNMNMIHNLTGANAPKGTLCGPHLKSPEELKFMPYFPTGTKSLLCQCMTPDVWEKMKDSKDKYGFTFKQAIFSGSKWTESGVGVYAGSHDSYYAFAPLFDKIIQNYHGHSKTDKHKSDMDYTKLKCPKFPTDEDQMINSVRIRVGRNLDGYPMGANNTL